MKKRSVLAAGAAVLVALGVFAGVSIAGASKEDAAKRVKILKPVTGVATPPGKPQPRAAAKPKGKKPTVQFFYASKASVPDEGEGVITALRCPRGKGEPIAGGALTQTGIVISYLSRAKPNGQTPPRTYYVGVDDTSDDGAQDGAGAIVQIQCAKNISVKHG